eukprot:8076685-Pyramimonas_sp.AAC.1
MILHSASAFEIDHEPFGLHLLYESLDCLPSAQHGCSESAHATVLHKHINREAQQHGGLCRFGAHVPSAMLLVLKRIYL